MIAPQRVLPAAVLMVASLVSAGAVAEEPLVFGNPDYFCRNGAFPGGGDYPGELPAFKPARITGQPGERIHFLKDWDFSRTSYDPGHCPDVDDPQCLDKPYLIPGDTVIVSKTLRGFACAWYQPKRGHETVGWLPLSKVAMREPEAHPGADAWAGVWKSGDDTLVLQSGDRGALRVLGRAYWPGRNAPPFHTGFVEGIAIPEHNTLNVEYPPGTGEARCRLRLSLVGPLLIASDNHLCGGVNVAFDGVYVRQRK
ncbi:hypothetical protein ACG04R_14915 [Roseateles sp. BYS78W]|uniref:Uncharacterized protein n=1 Tax=Pelomonas candidula TaxID=3299025 RepID=A0ABW7HDI9_9BURK